MSHHEEARRSILRTLQKFQEGYWQRDLTRIDDFMSLFCRDAQVTLIGTTGQQPGESGWPLGPSACAEMIRSDWQSWGDLWIDLSNAQVNLREEVAWVSAPGLVSTMLQLQEGQESVLGYVRCVVGTEIPTASRESIVDIDSMPTPNRNNSTVPEVQARRPIRFSAVLVREDQHWKIHQADFSFPIPPCPHIRYI
jgi:hypothetical protein